MLIVYLVLLLRFILPILYLWLPFQASWVNFILDSIDGDIIMHFGLDPISYQTWDKTADFFAYVMMLVVGIRWRIRKTIIVLFIYRSIGQILYFITGYDSLFFFFPNFLEPLFLIYTLLLFKSKYQEAKAYQSYQKHILLIWGIIIIIFKMWNEFNIHIIQNDLSSQFFGFNN